MTIEIIINEQLNPVTLTFENPKGDKGDPGEPLPFADWSTEDKAELTLDVVNSSGIQTVIGEAEAAATLATTKAGVADAAAQNADEAVAGIPGLIDAGNEDVATYAAMIASLGLSTLSRSFLVAVDENKGQENTLYKYFKTSNTLMWVAAIKEEL